jgi:hypothetical protein
MKRMVLPSFSLVTTASFSVVQQRSIHRSDDRMIVGKAICNIVNRLPYITGMVASRPGAINDNKISYVNSCGLKTMSKTN